MEIRDQDFAFCILAVFLFCTSSVSGLLSSEDVNYEVQALIGIKNSLNDPPYEVFNSWDFAAVNPCNWALVTCSPDNFVTALEIQSQNLSGTLSPSIGNLTYLETLLLQENNISGPIPYELGRLEKLRILDLSHNFFTGELPDSLTHLNSLLLLDVSYNNLSGPVPKINAQTFNVIGNPQIPATNYSQDSPSTSRPKNHKVGWAFASVVSCLCLLLLVQH